MLYVLNKQKLQQQLKMGNQQNSTNNISSIQNPLDSKIKQQLSLNLVGQLRVFAKSIIKQLKQLGYDVRMFQEQMKISKGLILGDNFEGKLNNQNKVQGIVKIYQKTQINKFRIYIGHYDGSAIFGKGIRIQGNTINKYDNKLQIVDKYNYKAYLLQKWESNPQQVQLGCTLKQQGTKVQYFKGQIQDLCLKKGNLKVLQNGTLIMEYQGQFLNNKMNGFGRVSLNGTYKYEGEFIRSQKNGIGKEQDLIKKTCYIGQFQSDRRHGYGQLTYFAHDSVKLKGFWNNGLVQPGQGMYISKDGAYLQTITQDINAL